MLDEARGLDSYAFRSKLTTISIWSANEFDNIDNITEKARNQFYVYPCSCYRTPKLLCYKNKLH